MFSTLLLYFFFISICIFSSHNFAFTQQNETPPETPGDIPSVNVPPNINITFPNDVIEITKRGTKFVKFRITATDPNLDHMTFTIDSERLGDIQVFRDNPGELWFTFEWRFTLEDIGVHHVTFTIHDDGDPSLSTTQTHQIELRLKENTPPRILLRPFAGFNRFLNGEELINQVDAGDQLILQIETRDTEDDEVYYDIDSTLPHSIANIQTFGGGEVVSSVHFDIDVDTSITDIGPQVIKITTNDDGIPPASLTEEWKYSVNPFREEPLFGRSVNAQPQVFFSAYENLEDIYTLPYPYSPVPSGHFQKNGGGSNRITYLSTGTVTGLGHNLNNKQVVVSYGPVTADAVYPNIINVYNLVDGFPEVRMVQHTFSPFPTGNHTIANYNGGELRTTVGNFLGSDVNQIAVAQGYGGKQVVRFFEITNQSRPHGWQVVKQFFGLTDIAAETNQYKGQTMASGDLDGDGLDELIVGQTNSPTSQTMFHLIDADNSPPGTIQSRLEFTAFLPHQRGNGGIEPVIADLNGDGQHELIITSQGNSRNHGDERDTAQTNLITILFPVVENDRVVDFSAPTNGTFSVFTLDQNPSGAVTIAAGEMDGNLENGDELILAANSIINVDGFQVTAQLPPPVAMYKVIKVNLTDNQIEKVDYLYHSENGKIPVDLPSMGSYPALLSNPQF